MKRHTTIRKITSLFCRSFDPLTVRQSHERSPLVTGMTPKDLHQHPTLTPRAHRKKGPGKLKSTNLPEQRLHSPTPAVCHSPAPSICHSPAPSGIQDRTEEFVPLSPDLGSQAPFQSLTSQSPKCRSRSQNIKPTAGTFSVAERKQLDKQLHNLLLWPEALALLPLEDRLYIMYVQLYLYLSM